MSRRRFAAAAGAWRAIAAAGVLIGLFAMHGAPTTMTVTDRAGMTAVHDMTALAMGAGSTMATATTTTAAQRVPMPGCSMDHGNCVTVLRSALSHDTLALAVVSAAVTTAFGFVRVTGSPVGRRAPPSPSLIGLCISRT
ncbi:DUF6153 family protein [Jatrophihabitans telluris]|uniref:DUF6153 family protein n=1 Tax=Jatrophihabitans telluris TaxID=2038343 RepID=A0ABY4R1B0_9ACTN|nr:DUF6153 family protein [Jatrophihabitans telluris]UQX88824.1 DUF6153 family protein [Jatrophihabitans telluris]